MATSTIKLETYESSLKAIAQALGSGTAIVYIVGFLIVSLHHASYGISPLNFLRTKIIAAGCLFFVFLSFPVLTIRQLQKMNKMGFLENGIGLAQSMLTSVCFRTYLILAGAIFMAWLARFALVENKPPFANYLWLLLASSGPVVTLTLVEMFGLKNTSVILLSIFFAIGLTFYAVWRIHDTGYLFLVIWFSLSSFVAYSVSISVSIALKSSFMVGAVIQNWLLPVVIFIGGFTFLVYPRVYDSIGGGAPVGVTLQFVDKIPPVGNSVQIKVWLIDETDNGFYFLQTKESKKAVFVPRNAVSAIYFGD